MSRFNTVFRQAVFVLGVAVFMPAQALTVAPAGDFSATGSLALTKGIVPVTCLTTFAGTVTEAGIINVTSVTFGGSNFICKRISALGLPWSGRADNNAQLTINGMQVDIRAPFVGGVCGPVNVMAFWSNEVSAAHFKKVSLTPDCTMDGIMATTPRVMVSP